MDWYIKRDLRTTCFCLISSATRIVQTWLSNDMYQKIQNHIYSVLFLRGRGSGKGRQQKPTLHRGSRSNTMHPRQWYTFFFIFFYPLCPVGYSSISNQFIIRERERGREREIWSEQYLKYFVWKLNTLIIYFREMGIKLHSIEL